VAPCVVPVGFLTSVLNTTNRTCGLWGARWGSGCRWATTCMPSGCRNAAASRSSGACVYMCVCVREYLRCVCVQRIRPHHGPDLPRRTIHGRQALHEHLGGASAYQMFASEVAPATLLYGSIALTVFARAADVALGAFAAVGAETSAVRNGVNLVLGRAGNKGMTGLSFRCFDATLAFVTCHYASDSGGKKRLRQRNLDARRTLREVRLTDDEGFHVAAQHHHTVRGHWRWRGGDRVCVLR
jgi:hypothetical protein